jgi:hypothetical protein
MKLSDQLIAENRYDEAIDILNLCFEEMPIEKEQVAADDICYYLCANYFEAGDTTNGNIVGKQLAELQLQRLKYFAAMDKTQLNFVWTALGKAMFNVEMLREASLTGMDRNKMFEPDQTNMNGSVSFANKGVLKIRNTMKFVLTLKIFSSITLEKKVRFLEISKNSQFTILSSGVEINNELLD